MIVITSNTILLHTINFLIFSKHVKGDNKVCNMKQSGFLKEGSTCYVQLYLYEYQNQNFADMRKNGLKIKPNDKSI